MRNILISIRPEWVEKILNGEKFFEIRKTMPKCELPCKVYIYCTKPQKWWRYSGYGVTSDELLWKTPNKIKMCNGFEFWENVEKSFVLNGKVVAEFILDKVAALVHHKGKKDTWNFNDVDDLDKFFKDCCLTMDKIVDYVGDNKNAYAWHISNLKVYEKPKELSEFKNAICNNYIKNVDVTQDIFGDSVAHYEDNFFCRKCNYFDGDFNTCDKKIHNLTKPPQSWCYVD